MKHFNKLTPAEHERLTLLIEECSEVIHIASKVMRHGYESKHPQGTKTNRRLLEEEVSHVRFAISLMTLDNHDLSIESIENAEYEKDLRVWRYLHHNKAIKDDGQC